MSGNVRKSRKGSTDPAPLSYGHIHTPVGDTRGLTDQSIELGVGQAMGMKWNANQHCRILELDADTECVKLHDLLWSPGFGGSRQEALEVQFARWKQCCAPARDEIHPRRDVAWAKCREVGLVEIRNNRTLTMGVRGLPEDH